MQLLDQQKEVAKILNRESVQFSSNLAYNSSKAWPFWYALIPYPYLNTDKLNGGLGLLGHRIPSGRYRDLSVRLDRDTAFRLINFKYTMYRPGFGAALTGTITGTSGSAILNGTLTAFENELTIGQTIIWLDNNLSIQFGAVKRINSALQIELDSALTSAATNVNYSRIAWKWYDTVQNQQNGQLTALTGILDIDAAGVVSGVATDFLNELAVGDTLVANDALGNTHHFIVDGVTLATAATVIPISGVTIPAGTTGYKGEYMRTLTGSVTIAALGSAVVGVGTKFTTELAQGSVFGVSDDAGVFRYFMVNTITNDTNMTITETLGAVGVTSASRMTLYATGGVTGVLSNLSVATRTVQGIGTSFDTEISVGDAIWYTDASGVVAPERAIVDHIDSASIMKFNNPVTQNGPIGSRIAIGVHTANVSPVPSKLSRFQYLDKYIRVTVSLPPLRNRYLYGGNERYLNEGSIERPRPVSTLQGSDEGAGGRLRTPSLLPYQGTINFRIHNDYSEDVFVNGHAFGYKIALEE